MDLMQYKHEILAETATFDKIDQVISEMQVERGQLSQEKSSLMQQLIKINKDQQELEKSLEEAESLKQKAVENVKSIRETRYDRLKEEIDQLRKEHGLKALPTIQEEIESETNAYLDQRRQNWTEPVLKKIKLHVN